MNPDQTAPKWEQSDLVPYCLQYRLPKNISRREEQMKSCDCGKRVNIFSDKMVWAHPSNIPVSPREAVQK